MLRTIVIALTIGVALAVGCNADVVEGPAPQPASDDDSCEGIHSCFGFLVLLRHEDLDGYEALLAEVRATFPDLECNRNVGGEFDVLCYPPGASCGFDEEADALALEQRFVDEYGDQVSTFVEPCACRGYC